MCVAGKLVIYFETEEHDENELMEELEMNASDILFPLPNGKTIKIGITQLILKELTKTTLDEDITILAR